MATLTERIVETESFGISDLIVALVAKGHDTPHPPDWKGRPYKIWRAEEHSYWNANAWAKMISEAPLDASLFASKTWDWTSTMNGGRVELRPSGWVDLDSETGQPRNVWREVGPTDANGGRVHGVIARDDGRPAPTPRTKCKCGFTHHG